MATVDLLGLGQLLERLHAHLTVARAVVAVADDAGSGLDLGIAVDEGQAQLTCQSPSDKRLAAPHHADERDGSVYGLHQQGIFRGIGILVWHGGLHCA